MQAVHSDWEGRSDTGNECLDVEGKCQNNFNEQCHSVRAVCVRATVIFRNASCDL